MHACTRACKLCWIHAVLPGLQEEVEFSPWKLQPAALDALLDAVCGWRRLTALVLGSVCSMDAKLDWQKLACSLSKCHALQLLSVSGGDFPSPLSSLLLPLAVYHHGLQHLDLKGAVFTSKQPGDVLHLAELRSLTFLSISTALLPTDEFPVALSQLHSLQHLQLSHTNLGSIPEAVRCISVLTNLTALDLSDSRIGVEAVPLLASSLRSLRKLQAVDMSKNFFPGCCSQLAAALATISSLQSVKFKNLELSEGESCECIRALEHLPCLTLLDLNGSVPSRELVDVEGLMWVHAEPSGTALGW
jgi:hypothetical protein